MQGPFKTDSALGVTRTFASDAAYLAATGYTPQNGDFYFNSALGVYRYWFTSGWVSMTTSGGGGSGSGFIKVTHLDGTSTTLPSSTSGYTPDGVSIANGDTVLFTALLSGNNEVYQAAISGTSITWTVQQVFSGGSSTPSDGDAVIILLGDSFATQVGIWNDTIFSFNNVVRYFNDTDYVEQDAINTSTLLNNSTGNVFYTNVVGSENIVVEYSMTRSGNKEVGTLWMTSDGSNAWFASGGTQETSLGVTFAAAVSGGSIQLNYTTDNSGGDTTVRYSLRRWSDSPGGSGGLITYSPQYQLGYVNSAYNMSQAVSTGYQLSTVTNVGGYSQMSLVGWSYLVGLNSGSPEADIDVIVNGQKIPRYISGVTTDAYWTEVNNTTVQFWTDITTSNVSVEIYKRQGTIDASAQSYVRVGEFYDAIVGTAAQVTAGGAGYTTLTAAAAGVPSGGKILVLQNAYAENVVIAKKVTVEGKGNGSSFTGTFTVNSGCDYSLFTALRYDGPLVINSNRSFFDQSWISSGNTVTDNGTGNYKNIITE